MNVKKIFPFVALSAVSLGVFYSAIKPVASNGEVIAASSTYGLIVGGFALGIIIFSLKLGKR